ncbi:hypothetical protein DICPUDRAFT_53869 [Dictyostelium purpureum]|uniref:Peptidase M20 dimerisation domain-containing protein n=1 Tax=Dictyostelium purpureum TaxID=5786 RepID=F0ZEM8_DICPU|nr:uncharacterized protein DICPUDRAFT_53869 [Dictyostelium purpureum]EGC37616.1 hypothetical protein DICPUDRAFT_53869 [Dictyostelium purpureum]|eukprot:XP_003285877.1 hypothetical protein DICPUDRAFT_53869 [Dictyostelium purpureum]
MSLNIEQVKEFSNKTWEESIIPTLSKYIEIPNQSPQYDPEWATNGLTEKAVELLNNWVLEQNVKGLKSEIKKIEGISPIIFITVESTKTENSKTVFLYGHMDKQPPLTSEWAEGLHPYKAVIKDGKLYGRGGADDGYSIFASVMAIKALQEQNISHDRYVIVIEGSEESGSIHLTQYIDKYQEEIGTPSLIVCLDSGCGNYEQLWMTSSLRGVLSGDLTVKVLDEACHSGSASGIVPSSFRILRQVIDRLENQITGEVDKRLHVEIPSYRIDQAKKCAEVLGDFYKSYSWHGNTQPITTDPAELLLNKTWRPTVCTTGVDGIPHISNAGNVMRTQTTVQLSIRLPPSLTVDVASKALKEILESNPPYGAEVIFNIVDVAAGWDAPAVKPWLEKALGEASQNFFNKPHVYTGEGGSIPFMGMLGEKFPEAQFVITGLLGPQSNAHGPNEFLHIDFGKKLLSCVVYLLDAHAKYA